jgi:hypothetical protein
MEGNETLKQKLEIAQRELEVVVKKYLDRIHRTKHPQELLTSRGLALCEKSIQQVSRKGIMSQQAVRGRIVKRGARKA